MKAITTYSAEEYDNQQARMAELSSRIAGASLTQLLTDLNRTVGYAHYRFTGRFTPLLVERLGRQPTADEIIMLVDGGFSHFGASCSINGNYFSGRVNTD